MLFETLKKAFPRMKTGELLKNHCTFRVGGPADYFYELFNVEELPQLITLANENQIPYVIFGRGSNVIFLDDGFRGLIIKNLSNRLNIQNDEITADSGVLLSEIIRKSVLADLTGLEPLYGLPGTIGGAIFGNAGVPGTEVSDFLKTVRAFNMEEGIHTHGRGQLDFSYRTSTFKKENLKDAIMKIILKLKKGDQNISKTRMKEIDGIRRGKQPTGYTCGSFFKNPSKEKSAGMLIEKAGLKGKRIGGAEISLKHANFFMNVADASACDILALRDLAKKTVLEKFGIILQEEVRIIE